MKKTFVIGIVALLAACGPDGGKDNNVVVVNGNPNNGTPNGTPNSTPNNSQLSERDQAIFDGYNAPANAKDAADGALSLTVEAVVLASIAATGGEQLVTTGTLTQSGEQFSYAAGPNDKLVVVWSEGPQTEIVVAQLDGNFEAETVDEFYGDDHVVQAHVFRDGTADIDVGSAKSGGSRQGGIAGSITEGGVTYQLDLEENGTTTSDIGTTISYESNSTMTGTITAPNLQLTAQEEFHYEHVRVDTSIENRSRTASSQWTYDGTTYAVNGLFLRSAFADGWPNEFDYWRAEGTIIENGNVVGQVQFEDDQFQVRIVLVLDSGEKVTLEEHLLYQDPNG